MGRIAIGTFVILAALLGLRQFSQVQKSEESTEFISHGEEVEIVSALPEEGYVVVEFTADW